MPLKKKKLNQTKSTFEKENYEMLRKDKFYKFKPHRVLYLIKLGFVKYKTIRELIEVQ